MRKSKSSFVLIGIDGKEYFCESNKDIFIKIGVPYDVDQAGRITALRRKIQKWVKIGDYLFYLKGQKPNARYLYTKQTEEQRKQKTRETRQRYYRNHLEKMKQEHRDYYFNNKEKMINYSNEWRKKQRRINPNFKLKTSIRSRILKTIKRGCKHLPSENLLGCNWRTAREHIESLWEEGMTWENHGLYGWHIDHIIPCAAFDLTKEEEQKKCFHYTNLQPLWAKENLRKGCSILVKNSGR